MTYFALLGGCLVLTLPLELVLGARVYARWRRLLPTLAAVLVVFVPWDAAAVAAGQWHYARLSGVTVGNLPLEELAFFVVVPTCAVLAFEAVRRLRPRWAAGDEPAPTRGPA